MSAGMTLNRINGKNSDKIAGEDPDRHEILERRKQRIVQVRHESKEFARKLREKVSKEKRRQLKKFNELKSKEFQTWQSQAAARMKHDYRACFSHVGSAHYAAKKENEQQAAKKGISSAASCSNAQVATMKTPKLPPFSQVAAAYYIPDLENDHTSATGKCSSTFPSNTGKQLKNHVNVDEQSCFAKRHEICFSPSLEDPSAALIQPREHCPNIGSSSNTTKYDYDNMTLPPSCHTQIGGMRHPRNPLSYPQIGSSYFLVNRQGKCAAANYADHQPQLPRRDAENQLRGENISPKETCTLAHFSDLCSNKNCLTKHRRISSNQDYTHNRDIKITSTSPIARVEQGDIQTASKNKVETKRRPLKLGLNKITQKAGVSPKPNKSKVSVQVKCARIEAGKKIGSPKRSDHYSSENTEFIQLPKCDCCKCSDSGDEDSLDNFEESCEISSTDSISGKFSEENYENTVTPSYQEKPNQHNKKIIDGKEKRNQNNVDVNTDTPSPLRTEESKGTKSSLLRKTPAVVLNVSPNKIKPAAMPNEISDCFTENNRKFSSIIRTNATERNTNIPDFENIHTPVASEPIPDSQAGEATARSTTSAFGIGSSTTTKTATETTKVSIDMPKIQERREGTNLHGSRKLPSTSTKSNEKSTEHTDKPRFTQISDLIHKRSTTHGQSHRDMPSTNKDVKQTRTSSKHSIQSQIHDKSLGLSECNEHPTKSDQKCITQQTTELSSACTDGLILIRDKKAATTSKAVNTDNVQFYDYNNKFHKTYPQPKQVVSEKIQNQGQQTAMEQARIEEERKTTRENEATNQRKRSEERGKKAIEREQVRRDCDALTQKLDALSKQYTRLLPIDPKIDSHLRFNGAATQKETKMNTAIEEMLMRPTIITCPEVTQPTSTKSEKSKTPQPNGRTINLGNPPTTLNVDSSATSTDSCHSLLLGYVNDQSKQIKNDINHLEANPLNEEKSQRLKALLERIDQLRDALLTELKSSTSNAGHSNVKNVENVIDSISAVRKERERIVLDNIVDKAAAPLLKREKELREKEAILERKIKDFYNLQKSETTKKPPVLPPAATESQHRVCANADKPLEIIIKVKNTPAKIDKPKSFRGKSPCKVSLKLHNTIAKRNKRTAAAAKKIVPPNSQNLQKISPSAIQNSYDSNSTSYRSLPSVIGSNVKKSVAAPQSVNECSMRNEPRLPSRLNPLIAHYVQRLLGMSRNSVLALDVSSSDIATPSESIVNTTANRSGSGNNLMSNERMMRVQKFIEDNHGLINQLEESLRGSSNSNISLESTMKAFEEIWKQKLNHNGKHENQRELSRPPETIVDATKIRGKAEDGKKSKLVAEDVAQKKPSRGRSTLPLQDRDGKKSSLKPQMEEQYKEPPNGSQVTVARKSNTFQKDPVKSRGGVNQVSESIETDGTPPPQRDFARYAQLTDNCTQRIAELTELIHKVREEKQKILENTLSSVSENGCTSTDYMELPVTTDKTQAIAANTPLEKYKDTGISRDSGISESRPVTSQEHRYDLQDPVSVASSTHTSSSTRKPKPPPSLARFSPQLIEDELVHELSTIPEVDTPATSRLNASIASSSALKTSTQRIQPASKFPTFEQYINQAGVDLTQPNPEQSIQLNQEFENLLVALSDARGNIELNWKEFPSLNAYLEQISGQLLQENGNITLSETSPETIENLLACLRLSTPNINAFPSSREYIRRIANNASEGELIDSVSLDNITVDCLGRSTESESINIEDELRRRNILNNSFPRMSPSKKDEFFNTTSEQKDITMEESGIDKMTSSTHSGELERDLYGVGIRWPKSMRAKCKEAQALRSSSSTETSKYFIGNDNSSETDKSQSKNSTLGDQKQTKKLKDNHSDDCHRMNLCDFLTKELLKHRNRTSNSTSTSDESLRSQFLQNIIGSLTPSGTPRTTGPASKQKTSTPFESDTTKSTSSSSVPISSQLFSVESRLSSVRYQYTPRQSEENKKATNYEDGKNL